MDDVGIGSGRCMAVSSCGWPRAAGEAGGGDLVSLAARRTARAGLAPGQLRRRAEPQSLPPASTCAVLGGSSVKSCGTLTARRCLRASAAKTLSIARTVWPWFSCMRMIAPGTSPSITVRSICA